MYGNYDDNNDTNYDTNYANSQDDGEQPTNQSGFQKFLNNKQTYAGMTVPQLALLGGMALALVLIIGCGGWFVVSSSEALAVKRYTLTPRPTVVPSVTPIVYMPSPTPEPTLTPTPIPYEQLIPPGWKQYKTSLVEIWMPSNFKLADKKTKDLTANLGKSEILLTEVSSKSSLNNILVGVSYDLKVDTNLSLDEFLSSKLAGLQSQAQILRRQTVYVNSRETHLIQVEFNASNILYNSLIFVIQDGSTVWYIEYVAEITEYFNNNTNNSGLFFDSVKTFRPASY